MATAEATKQTATKQTASNQTMAKKSKAAKTAKPAAAKPAAKKSAKKSSPVDEMLKQNANLNNAVQAIEKQFGEGAIMPLVAEGLAKIEGISTGSLSLDMALGGRGLPCGRII